MHVAWASFMSAFAAPVTAVTVAIFFASVVAARSPEVVRIVPRRQQASRPLPTAIANDTPKNEACHVA
ncbi:hypothetical protein ACFSHT_25600 [Paraburkholderia silviterrae]|uniref:Uncharacterized protein n=1 Tax=Paraburkholderia silviterrae TaxID=2528715 RepID=A0A4R5M7U3_9BURK|nr:hypothetical protein [Paraburkholderia silviterrae]TDG22290.1 hypothetical protein EYW47_17585 [Paraburkholderia silviterrae]